MCVGRKVFKRVFISLASPLGDELCEVGKSSFRGLLSKKVVSIVDQTVDGSDG